MRDSLACDDHEQEQLHLPLQFGNSSDGDLRTLAWVGESANARGVYSIQCLFVITADIYYPSPVGSGKLFETSPFSALPGCQSEHHMKVGHRHSVPLSLLPLGPSGRAHIQKLRP